MRRILFLLPPLLVLSVSAFAEAPAPAPTPQSGRFQLIVVAGHAGSPFLIDTASGCIWHLVQHQETKRSTFIEVDVENLHWSWGSGAQQMLASRIEASNLPDQQKQSLKQELQKTGCGLTPLVLTPAPAEPPRPAEPRR
jgi:hypothetical protein